jgi:hypothetical protein
MVDKPRWKKELKRERRVERDERTTGPRTEAARKERAVTSRAVADESAPKGLLRPGTQWIWALVTGLAVGFAVGRETGRASSSKSDDEASAEPESTETEATAPKPSKLYKKESEFPAGWVKPSELDKPVFAGLSEPQKLKAVQALNERNCECGCTFGTLANCLHKDPNCPRSPQIATQVVDLVKQGKSLSALLAAIDQKQKELGGGGGDKPAAQQPPVDPGGRQKVQIAKWSPRKGPKTSKVTIVEVSDFQ